MHTHNINVKTATRKTPERCGQGAEQSVIKEQQSLLLRLAGLWNLQLPLAEEVDEISILLESITENVRLYGVTDWSREKPRVKWSIACWWVQAQNMAIALYESAGMEAVKKARTDMADMLAVGKYEYRIENAGK
jgi:hypothetical protein